MSTQRSEARDGLAALLVGIAVAPRWSWWNWVRSVASLASLVLIGWAIFLARAARAGNRATA
ncbi:MAG: hypothetical protein RIM84_13085 [Alphaproteobacteria bacterium]